MMYLIYFGLIFIFSFFVTERKQALMVVLLLTFLYLAFSFPAGNDWINYFENYDCIVNRECDLGFVMFEPGYQAIVYMLGSLGFQSITFFIAVINIIFLYIFANKFENKALIVSFMMCVFIWTLYFEAVRQSIAMSIFIVSLYLLYRGKVKQYVLLILCAALFHITALVCLILVLPYISIKLSRILGYGLLIGSFIFVGVPTLTLKNIIAFLPADSMVALKLNFYLISEIYRPKLSIGTGALLDIILICLILISFIRIKKYQLYTNYTFHHVVFLGTVLYLSFGVFIGKMMPVFTRVGWYGIPIVMILVYLNIGNSLYYRQFSSNKGFSLSGVLLCTYFMLQVLRPMTYDLNRYNIIHQVTVLQKIDRLDDASLRNEADLKCHKMWELGYGQLCD